MEIHSTAIVDESAVLGEGCTVGAYAIIEGGVHVGPDCTIASHAVLREGTHLGRGVRVDSFTVLGGEPQSVGFDSSIKSGVRVGDGVTFRESCTVHRSMFTGKETVIGNNCFFMAQAHVAHDCVLGESVIAANLVLLGGHVSVGDRVFLGGGAGVHQFCRIGSYAILAGHGLMTRDLPPTLMAAGRNRVHGLNLVGLRRAGIERDVIKDLKACYQAVYEGDKNYKARRRPQLLQRN
ncbi:MAG: acyl-ACP--UDP-N-acetylglucosamine O-acyltransferase [Verrucomicrobia bacterium]|nr:acyl-ACP--UDP-N-acetylglucosamine O-acyltransferase [Verrucomicrobiota bacterium]